MLKVLWELSTKLFEDKCIEENRDPLITFRIPGVEGNFGLLPPKGVFWNQVILQGAVFMLVQTLASIAVYFLIVKKRGSTSSFLVGYGFIIPMAFQLGYWLLEHLDIHNKDQKICVSMVSTVIIFRTIEAMHDTTPSGKAVEASLSNFISYYNAMVHYDWDEKKNARVPARPRETMKRIVTNFVNFHFMSLLISLLLHFDFQVFESNVPLDSFYLSTDLLAPGHLANCYLLAVAFYMLTYLGLNLNAMALNLQGFSTLPVFLNPLFASESPSDFWGRRWNLTMHRNLKGGVYTPLMKVGVFKELAFFATFAVSGLMHDFYTSLVFYKHKRNVMREEAEFIFGPIHSKMLAFFLYNWVLFMLERPVYRYLIPRQFKEWQKRLQTWQVELVRPVLSTLVLLMSLPVSHWFTSQWALGGYFSDKSHGYWTIVKMDS